MKAIEEKLPSGEFFRVHRSFIVAFDKIDFIQKQALSIGGREIPISESYRDQLFRIINHESTPEPE
jgi:DNA-binding LytR/AlgR family response regulator